ncbi:uncharacterized protein ARMOST_15494 [Armillaria ostoyae]|uniref:Uncharacterized protein n=1 Tax=Armillaria ostoyae TaxID=47428 RepID=A0A284RTI3_ARMOS|nr:uncharacterized protein ARMOST_15494 [Armillaria ostoyae]
MFFKLVDITYTGGDRYYEYKLRYTRPPSPARRPGLTSRSWAKHTHATVEQKHPGTDTELRLIPHSIQSKSLRVSRPYFLEKFLPAETVSRSSELQIVGAMLPHPIFSP